VKKIILAFIAFIAVTILGFLVVFVLFGLSIRKSVSDLQKTEKMMRSPEYFQEAAKQLALYCQSINIKISDRNTGYILYPKIIHELDPARGHISPQDAWVTIAGGFYRLCYSLEFNKKDSDEEYNVWELYICTDYEDEKLYTVKLNKQEKIPIEDIVKNAIEECNKRIEEQPKSYYLHRAKIHFLLLFNQSESASQACKESIEKLPNHWLPRLTLAFIESGMGKPDEAYKKFSNWIENNPSFTRYFYLAYFCYLEKLIPEFALAVEKALKCPLTTNRDDSFNVYYIGWNMALMAHKNKRYDLAMSVCEAMEDPKREKERAKSSKRNLYVFRKFKKVPEPNDISATVYSRHPRFFNPYQSTETNAVQPIKVGKHQFPIR
jgi:tetratricopeptide (TPR) repeat protein